MVSAVHHHVRGLLLHPAAGHRAAVVAEGQREVEHGRERAREQADDHPGAEAELRPAAGKRQYVNKRPDAVDDDEPNQMMLLSDMILAWDPAFRVHLEAYADDEALLKRDFGAAFKKLTELGCGFS